FGPAEREAPSEADDELAEARPPSVRCGILGEGGPAMAKRDVCVIGVGMTKFERCERDFTDLVREAVSGALGMSGVAPDQLEQAFAGYVNGMSTQGQRALYSMGIGGLPVYNVHNYCSTGSTALHLGYQAIASGMNECVLAFGFEKMEKGPLEKQLAGLKETIGAAPDVDKKPPIAAVMFGDGGRQHMEKYGTTKEQFAKVSVKNHRHSVNNPRSQYQEACSLEEVLAARMVYDPLTILQCSLPSDGAGAAILCSEELAWKQATYVRTWADTPPRRTRARGHRLGATGRAQCAELVWRLPGKADKRQVERARVWPQHNVGLGAACAHPQSPTD